MLRRAADPRQDVDDCKGREAGRERLGDEPTAEQQPAGPQQSPPRDQPCERGEAELDDAGGEGAAGRKEGNRIDTDVEVVGDLQVDERQDDRLGVVDRMGDREPVSYTHLTLPTIYSV